jgi:hypothetical protein
MSPRGACAGFVLIEALATLALSALVLAGAATLVGFMLRAADRSAMALEQLETTGRAMAAVERDIRAAVRVYRQSEQAATLVFLGGPEQFMVVIDRRNRDGLTAPVVVRWRSEETTAGRGRLIRSEAPLLPGVGTPGEDVGPRVAVDTGPAVIRFAYFAPQPDGDGEVLTDDWTTPQTMPTAIRLGRADPGSLQVRSSVRVPIRVDAEIGCVDPAKGVCSLTGGRRPTPSAEEGDLLRRDMQPPPEEPRQ